MYIDDDIGYCSNGSFLDSSYHWILKIISITVIRKSIISKLRSIVIYGQMQKKKEKKTEETTRLLFSNI